MEAKQVNGRVVVTVGGFDEFGERGKGLRMMSLKEARRLRDELNAAIKACEEMCGFSNGTFCGTD